MTNNALTGPLVISMGEPAGIGIDCLLIACQSVADGTIAPLPDFIVTGRCNVLRQRAKMFDIELDIQAVKPEQLTDLNQSANTVYCIETKNQLAGQPAQPIPADAAGIVEAIVSGVNLVRRGHARGLVTLPINKNSLYESGFSHPGHTEFLAELTNSSGEDGKTSRPVMLLAGPQLRAVPVTIHIPLASVSSQLTTSAIIETAKITAADLESRFGIKNPRLAISGLNPHAGEGGAMGHEDQQIISPAVAELNAAGIDCVGPLPADTMFHPAARARYDVAICMYHDQALIPAKALDFDETVNVTLGLPIVRTSPDHGTAFDIAGTGKANPASTIAAMRLADQMSRAASQ